MLETRSRQARSLLCLAALLLAACPDDSKKTCSEGESQACTCDGGGAGSQTCDDAGEWGPCQCGAADAAADGPTFPDGLVADVAQPDVAQPDVLAPDTTQVPCYSLSFNGSTDKVTTANSGDFNFGAGDFTIEAWIKVDGQSGTVLSRIQYNNGYLLAVEGSATAGRLFFAVGQCKYSSGWTTSQYMLGFVTPAGSLPMSSWTHVAASRQGNAIVVHIDGKQTSVEKKIGLTFPSATAGAINECYYDTGAALTLGAGNFSTNLLSTDPVWKLGGPFKGQIGELRITRKAIYTVDFAPTKTLPALTETVLLYPFDEGSGTTLTDASTKQHDGTVSGATWASDCP